MKPVGLECCGVEPLRSWACSSVPRTGVAPKTEVYRICTEHFMSSIRKAEFGHAVTASPSTAPTSLGPFGPVGGFRLAMVSRFWPSSKPVSGEMTIRQRQLLQGRVSSMWHVTRPPRMSLISNALNFGEAQQFWRRTGEISTPHDLTSFSSLNGYFLPIISRMNSASSCL